MNWSPLQKHLPKAAAHYGFADGLKAAQICQEYRNLAPSLLPEGALDQTAPRHYRRHILTIGVFNSAWAQQVFMRRHQFIQAINAKFGAQTVKDVRIETVEQQSELHQMS